MTNKYCNSPAWQLLYSSFQWDQCNLNITKAKGLPTITAVSEEHQRPHLCYHKSVTNIYVHHCWMILYLTWANVLTKNLATYKCYCWWFRNPVNSPVFFGQSPIIHWVLYIPGGWEGDLFAPTGSPRSRSFSKEMTDPPMCPPWWARKEASSAP